MIGTFVVYSLVIWCGMVACGAYVVLPILPWVYIFGSEMGVSLPFAVYPMFLLLNVSVAYVVGVGIEWCYERIRE